MVYVCGICDSHIKDISDHERFIEKNTVLIEGTNVALIGNSINNHKELVDSLDKNCYTEERDNDETDFRESLINEVHKRPTLYNSKLPIILRSREKISQLWNEVFNVFESKNISHALYYMIKWRTQRDRYLKVRSQLKQYIPSGSAATKKKNITYKYYHLMQFLDGCLEEREQVSNFQLINKNSETHASTSAHSLTLSPYILHQQSQQQEMKGKIIFDSTYERPLSSSMKQRKCKRTRDDLEMAVLRNLQKPIDSPQLNQLDEIDNFCQRLATGLRKLPPRERIETELAIFQYLVERETKYIE